MSPSNLRGERSLRPDPSGRRLIVQSANIQPPVRPSARTVLAFAAQLTQPQGAKPRLIGINEEQVLIGGQPIWSRQYQLAHGLIRFSVRTYAPSHQALTKQFSTSLTRKPPILFLPGLESTRHGADPFFKAASDPLEQAVYVLDRHYVDASGKVDITEKDWLVQEAVAALDWVSTTHKTPVHLVGFSLGGHLAARVAGQHPDQVKSVHLLSPTFISGRAHWFWMGVVNTVALTGTKAYNALLEGTSALLGRQTPLLTKGPEMTYRSLKALGQLTHPCQHPAVFKAVSRPIQILVGQKELLSPDYLRQLLKQAGTTQSEIRVIPKVGHTVTEDHLALMTPFMKAHS